VCPNRAIFTYQVKPQNLLVPQFALENGELVKVDTRPYRIRQAPQVAVLADACNECGNCATFCPTSGSPWRDKPRLYLHREDFEAATDNAFMLVTHDGARGLQARFEGLLHQLIEESGALRYTSPFIELHLEAKTMTVLAASIRRGASGDPLVNPDHLGAMITLHRSFAASMPEYPLIGIDQRQIQ
jgi:putative selenate reductase